MDKTSIIEDIIKYLEANGEQSKSKIEDHLKETKGTTGDCVSRRLRELVAEGIVSKAHREYAGKMYWSYRVVEENKYEIQTTSQQQGIPTTQDRLI